MSMTGRVVKLAGPDDRAYRVMFIARQLSTVATIPAGWRLTTRRTGVLSSVLRVRFGIQWAPWELGFLVGSIYAKGGVDFRMPEIGGQL